MEYEAFNTLSYDEQILCDKLGLVHERETNSINNKRNKPSIEDRINNKLYMNKSRTIRENFVGSSGSCNCDGFTSKKNGYNTELDSYNSESDNESCSNCLNCKKCNKKEGLEIYNTKPMNKAVIINESDNNDFPIFDNKKILMFLVIILAVFCFIQCLTLRQQNDDIKMLLLSLNTSLNSTASKPVVSNI